MVRRPFEKLTRKHVNEPIPCGRWCDGNGLYLVVDLGGAKRWVLRTVINGKRREMGLGSVRLVSLNEARKKAREYRRVARAGGDPIAERRALSQRSDATAERQPPGSKTLSAKLKVFDSGDEIDAMQVQP